MLTQLRVLVQHSSLPIHFICGIIAFLIFELSLAALLEILGLTRAGGFFYLEFMIFVSASGLLYSYSVFNQRGFKNQRRVRRGFLLSDLSILKRFDSMSEGILESLSAIMFFARAHLVGAEDTQKARDLREIMERIDQVQLLVQEIRVLINGDTGADRQLFPKSNRYPEPSSPGSGIQSNLLAEQGREGSKGRPKRVYSLRKSARKVVILPITVRYLDNKSSLEFQTYTVNVCEEGACIILSSNSLTQEGVIDVRISSEFMAQARIKWIQPFGANLFRLGGIEFLDGKYQTNHHP